MGNQPEKSGSATTETEGQRKPKTPTDPTISAMRQLDTMFTNLNRDELSFVLNWAVKKHRDKNIRSLITT